MNILCLYNATQTFTNAVFEHLDALARFSRHRFFFMHTDPACPFAVDLARFDAVCVHFSIRLPFDQLSTPVVEALRGFSGLKFLFIQDEYDNTCRTWHWINTVGFQLVFTVVPERGIERVYPPEHFPNVRFRTNLTGYVPSDLAKSHAIIPPSMRSLVIGYRGRPLPLRYGVLGFEKVEIGRMVRAYCEQEGIPNDIAWTEEARIYGPAWYSFMSSCRAMLGSESGSNVFNWDGQLESKLADYRKKCPNSDDAELYQEIVRPLEVVGIMNQVSPRVFEAIAARTVLVLFEGEYSGVIRPDEHFISLRKDGANLPEVFAKLNDSRFVDDMAERVYRDVIESGRYSYCSFVEMVDKEVESLFETLTPSYAKIQPETCDSGIPVGPLDQITTTPIRAVVHPFASSAKPILQWDGSLKVVVPVAQIWAKVPEPVRAKLRPMAHRLKRALSAGGS